jgi:hypothetical protein
MRQNVKRSNTRNQVRHLAARKPLGRHQPQSSRGEAVRPSCLLAALGKGTSKPSAPAPLRVSPIQLPRSCRARAPTAAPASACALGR